MPAIGEIIVAALGTVTAVQVSIVILGDVTYGACCIDDVSAGLLGVHFLVHYGHSCLVPSTVLTPSPTADSSSPLRGVQYVFVEIDIDVGHAVDSLAKLLGSPTDLLPLLRDAHGHPVAAHDMASCPVTLYIVCTIQFAAAAAAVRTALTAALAAGADAARAAGLPDVRVASPQAKPLSPGEILGCTAPVLADTLPTADAPRTTGGIIVYLGDGRFHLESIMLANPHLTAIRYDPYDKRLTQEEYGHSESRTIRRGAIEAARSAKVVGIILGGLGRQGNPAIVGNLRRLLDSTGIRHFTLVLSEVFPAKLAAFSEGEEKVDAFVQVACPRLSIDWGHFFTIPLLNTFEAFVAFDPAHAAAYPEPDQLTKSVPMDYYAKVGGPWANYHPTNKGRSLRTAA